MKSYGDQNQGQRTSSKVQGMTDKDIDAWAYSVPGIVQGRLPISNKWLVDEIGPYVLI